MSASGPAAPELEVEVSRLFAGEPEALADANHIWRRLREEAPVFEYGPITLVSRYEDVHLAFRHDAMTKNTYVEGSWTDSICESLPPDSRELLTELRHFESMYVVRSSGADHERRRRVAHRAFTPRRIGDLTGDIERFTDELIDLLLASDEPDLMRFAYELPLMAIASMLGMPNVDRDLIHGWAGKLLVNLDAADPETLAASYGAIMQLRGHVQEAIELNRNANDHTQLVSALLEAEENAQISQDELVATYANFIVAGFETTMNLIGVGLLELLRHPDQWRLLCEDPVGRAPNAVEEMRRFVSPAQWSLSLPVARIEFSAGTIPPGRTVFMILAAANRDPATFEDPEELDILRANAREHVSLGHGAHFCLGASLARAEGRVAFERLARRFPDLELADEPLVWCSGSALRRPRRVAVNLGRDTAASARRSGALPGSRSGTARLGAERAARIVL